MRRYSNIILILIASSGIFGCSEEVTDKFVLCRPDSIYVIDEATKYCEVVFVDNRNSFLEESTRLSPSGKYLAIPSIGSNSRKNVCNEDSSEVDALIVIELTTNTSKFICNAADYCWAPDRDKLAYIPYYDSYPDNNDGVGDNFFSGHEVWLYDARTDHREEMAVDSKDIQSLNWEQYDGNIYLYEYDAIKQFNTGTSKTKAVSFQGIYISPDGKYCFRESVDDPCGLYLIEDQSEIPMVKAGTTEPVELYSHFITWGMINGKTVIYTNHKYLGYIDCATGQLHEVKPPSPAIDPVNDLVGFKDGRPVWARINGDKAELFYY